MNCIDRPSSPQVVSRPERKTGRLQQWDDSRGYGWVEMGKHRIFVHIKEFEPRRRRPMDGDEIEFAVGLDLQGRTCARQVHLVRSGGKVSIGRWSSLLLLLVLPVSAGCQIPGAPFWIVPSGMAVSSVVAWAMYRADKHRAESHRWRIPESRLHFWEFWGGWPGGFLAQAWFRHKTRKSTFQVLFWLIVAIHQLIAFAWIMRDHWEVWRQGVGRLFSE
ncbi:uncharacterized membrane protein YsdA (DUF1294 family)/cold shock CspA family protein [Haloferula luteola]|uniref:Uncharacterized membrane protein YsdA (DUF1294 family)/cold shock CspA family protein n=1 Tax=Haloferula luteola TaxID=595692 RepID=A0A840V0P8_9BACT|nr:DUF1294 domain-containing protein [Haloferula luteola]MBB5351565.1 uncharacterized membrane protein YsdA (DUF1294 family)/cold shock CspA family protein [Haloferula luteola]